MANILLFGPNNIKAVPNELISWLQQYTQAGHRFIVGGSKGTDATLHRALSSIGAGKQTVIYCMDSPTSNVYDFEVESFITKYNGDTKQVIIESSKGNREPYVIDNVEKEIDIPNNRQWYEFRDRQMINDCDIAIGVWDGDSKRALHMVQLLNIHNKPCYLLKI
jgi:hypothetical protein